MPVLKTHIPNSQLFHDLKEMGRDNFSYDGATALMEYLEQLSEDIDGDIEYDPIAFCCDFAEYAGIEEIYEEYSNIFESVEECADKLDDHTSVIKFDGGIIIQSF